MRKLLFILVLFFSTSVFAETWVMEQDQYGLDFYQSQGYEVVDVKTIERKGNYLQFVYTLTHPEGGFKICNVFFAPSFSPEITQCFSEYIID
tara:strand:+ start:156 stop:431 length:276 start_codon:yes stop_codon:yes gene_type:complete